MIPKLIQRRGAQHLAEEEAELSPGDNPALNPPPEVLERRGKGVGPHLHLDSAEGNGES
jgi:hypothetical protein